MDVNEVPRYLMFSPFQWDSAERAKGRRELGGKVYLYATAVAWQTGALVCSEVRDKDVS